MIIPTDTYNTGVIIHFLKSFLNYRSDPKINITNQRGVQVSFVFKLNILIFICSCGTVIPTDKLVNSSVNSAEISTIISNVSDSFSASASDSSIANGAEVLYIAPGSLAMGASVSISAAEDIASNDLDGMLGTSGITPGGPAVYFESSGSTISSNPMTITLPISSTRSNYSKHRSYI